MSLSGRERDEGFLDSLNGENQLTQSERGEGFLKVLKRETSPIHSERGEGFLNVLEREISLIHSDRGENFRALLSSFQLFSLRNDRENSLLRRVSMIVPRKRAHSNG
jgi:hypothetical protein